MERKRLQVPCTSENSITNSKEVTVILHSTCTTSMDKQQRFNFQKRMKISMPLLCYQTKPKIRIKTHPEIVKNLTSISISRPLTMRSLMNWTLMVAALFSESPMDISDTSSLSIGRGFGSTVQRYSKLIKYVID